MTVNAAYVLGTFTATTPTDSFTYAEAGGAVGEINALSLRDLSAVPEPSTYVLLLGGFGALGLAMRGRRLLA